MQHGTRSPFVRRRDQSRSKLVHRPNAIRRFTAPFRSHTVTKLTLRRAATFTFYVQTWDEYYTQTLTLGIVSGPVEGILTLCIVYAFTAIKGGGSFWQQSMLATLGIAKHDFIPEYIYNLPFNQWYMVYGGIVLVFNTTERQLHPSIPPSFTLTNPFL